MARQYEIQWIIWRVEIEFGVLSKASILFPLNQETKSLSVKVLWAQTYSYGVVQKMHAGNRFAMVFSTMKLHISCSNHLVHQFELLSYLRGGKCLRWRWCCTSSSRASLDRTVCNFYRTRGKVPVQENHERGAHALPFLEYWRVLLFINPRT